MKAVLNIGHTGCVGGMAIMLRSLGYEVVHLNDDAISKLHMETKHGFGTARSSLYWMGYEKPLVPFVGLEALDGADLYVDIKEDNMDVMSRFYPSLKKLLFSINGGREPYNVSKYPVVSGNFYAPGFLCYPPFMNQFGLSPRQKIKEFTAPMGLLHNASGWGFGEYLEDVTKLGIQIYGGKGSPAGNIRQRDLHKYLSTAKAFVHMKAIDAPGYALYEAMASGVPVILPQLFVDRTKYSNLYIDEKTCLTFGAYAAKVEGNPDKPIESWEKLEVHQRVIKEIASILKRLEDPEENYRIGHAGYLKWKELTDWTEEKADKLEAYFKQNGLL